MSKKSSKVDIYECLTWNEFKPLKLVLKLVEKFNFRREFHVMYYLCCGGDDGL